MPRTGRVELRGLQSPRTFAPVVRVMDSLRPGFFVKRENPHVYVRSRSEAQQPQIVQRSIRRPDRPCRPSRCWGSLGRTTKFRRRPRAHRGRRRGQESDHLADHQRKRHRDVVLRFKGIQQALLAIRPDGEKSLIFIDVERHSLIGINLRKDGSAMIGLIGPGRSGLNLSALQDGGTSSNSSIKIRRPELNWDCSRTGRRYLSFLTKTANDRWSIRSPDPRKKRFPARLKECSQRGDARHVAQECKLKGRRNWFCAAVTRCCHSRPAFAMGLARRRRSQNGGQTLITGCVLCL